MIRPFLHFAFHCIAENEKIMTEDNMNIKEAEAKAAMVERYPDPNIEDPQLYDKLLTLPGDQVRCRKSWNVGDGHVQ